MIGFRPFSPDDLDGLEPGETVAREVARPENARDLSGWTMTRDGHVVGCAGLHPMGGVLVAWAVVGEATGLKAMSRRIVQALEEAGKPVETYVAWDFMKSHRWVQHLGFRMDAGRPTQFVSGVMMVRYLYVGRGK